MANVQAKDANGKPVQVHQAQFNNLGEVESLYIRQGNHLAWVHARDFEVTVDAAAEQEVVDQPGVMTKNTQFQPSRVLEKSPEGQALKDPANDDGPADQPPVPPSSTPNPTVAPPVAPPAPEQPPRELSPHEHIAPGGDFEPVLDDSQVPVEPVVDNTADLPTPTTTAPELPDTPGEPVPSEQTKPADDGVLSKDDISQ